MSSKIKKFTLGYWSTKGLGAASRQMIIYAGIPLVAKIYKVLPKEENGEINYEGSSWHDNDKIELKKKNSLINLPYLQFLKDDEEYVISHQILLSCKPNLEVYLANHIDQHTLA